MCGHVYCKVYDGYVYNCYVRIVCYSHSFHFICYCCIIFMHRCLPHLYVRITNDLIRPSVDRCIPLRSLFCYNFALPCENKFNSNFPFALVLHFAFHYFEHIVNVITVHAFMYLSLECTSMQKTAKNEELVKDLRQMKKELQILPFYVCHQISCCMGMVK